MFSRWTQFLRQWIDDPRFRENQRVRLGIYIGLGVAMFLLLLGSVLPPRYQFTVGQTSPVTIVAPITAVDTVATKEAQEAAANRVQPQYTQSASVETKALQTLDSLFQTASQLAGDKNLTLSEKLATLTASAPKGVSSSTLQPLLTMSPQQVEVVQSVSERIVRDLLGAPFYKESLQEAQLLVDQQIVKYDLGRQSSLIVQDLVVSVLQPNMIYNQAATEAAKKAAERSVGDVYIHQGDVIVPKNGVVTQSVIDRMKDVGLYGNQHDYGMVLGFMAFVLISIGSLAAYIERRPPRRRLDNLMLLVTALVLLLMGIMISVTKDFMTAGAPTSAAYLEPVAVGSMLLAVLTDSSLAVVASFFVSLWFGAALGFNYWYAFIGFLSALVGAYSVAKVTHRGTFMRAGFLVAGINLLSILAMHLLQADNSADFRSFSLHAGLGLLNGVLCAVLTMGILPFFESAFGLLTAIRLLELSNPNNPLLRKVLLEAPGTYHHSLIVGNLAEAAAEIVGADPLICRVGAYYHDVGKTRRPLFFVENQMTKENPHEKIAPSLSHLIITSHVSDGLEMLQKAGLPKPIRDICATHHGTTILWYFYNKAKEQDKNGVVKIDDFRYPGPKPKTRECAIVMICDAVEAAVRSMSKPTPNRVEGVIRKIIRDRLQDGQLDECDLTLQDLDVMVPAFMKTLKGIYHARIEYPDPDKIRKEIAK
ncbi:HDIG domain-containing protein [Alicyclobacillus cycloheptanicus]|uniref:Nucleotidyltransferase with HDIG domain n=1 Tax=Alicyclobacillus cycloheptanicus TaxID=1457 RepID=A0ABT9XKA2_9BACL|nr:HDIG domain-containing metalloprotein [Alicyclobacillus cycloheptanicus]MDQ0190474.1 putative nucleotidyltransferase with HDIG domain [Alicyclobacillus cycloheptanicus]WDM00763.1 HDIG domain-containing protein [Alicyclobacillus cycloheptanicus]